MQIDLILDNARIITGDEARPEARRIGLWNGAVVGLDEQLDGLTATERLDLHGKTVCAGFNDVHAHSVWFGQTLIDVDLAAASTAEEVYRAVRQRTDTLAPGDWVTCSNFNPLGFRGPLPDRDGLDQAGVGRPVLLRHASGHAYTVSGTALALAGVPDQPVHQPEGGLIKTDATGRSTGLLEETAMSAVQALLQPESQEYIAACLARATEQYAREGITSVTDAGIAGGWIGHSPLEFAAYQQARDAGLLKTRMQTMITLDALHPVPGHPKDGSVRTLDAGIRTGVGDEWLQIGPVKVFTDGSLLGATAAMTEDYAHCSHERGYLQQDPEQMRQQVLAAAAGGWSLALHAIGDAAMDFALDMLQDALRRYGSGRMPHRIEHGGVVRDDQILRIAELGVVLVPQPYFIPTFGDGMARNLGPERTALSYPAARLLAQGITLPGSSDRPVAGGHPLSVIQAFVERRTESGQDYGPADRISVEQALHAYTVGSAAATGWADRKGRLTSGHLADVVVLGQDPREVPRHELSSIDIVATMVGGHFVFGGL